MENPYESPSVGEPPDFANRPRFPVRVYHAIAVAWFVTLLSSSLYLSRVEQLPPAFHAYWPVAIEFYGAVCTLFLIMPAFAIRAAYLLLRRRFRDAGIDAAFAIGAFLSFYSALMIHPMTD